MTRPQVGHWQSKRLEGHLGSVDSGHSSSSNSRHCRPAKLPSLQNQLTASGSEGESERGPPKPPTLSTRGSAIRCRSLQRWELAARRSRSRSQHACLLLSWWKWESGTAAKPLRLDAWVQTSRLEPIPNSRPWQQGTAKAGVGKHSRDEKHFFPEIPSCSLHCCVYRQELQQQLERHHFPQRWVLTGQ